MTDDPVAEHRTADLKNWGRRLKATLKDALEAMADADRFRLSAIYGAIGATGSTAATIIAAQALAFPSLYLALPFIVPAAGLLGLRFSYSKEDMFHKRRLRWVDDANDRRDEEIDRLDHQIKNLWRSDPATVRLLQQKRRALSMASNDQLLRWAGYSPPNEAADSSNPLLTPLIFEREATAQLTDMSAASPEPSDPRSETRRLPAGDGASSNAGTADDVL